MPKEETVLTDFACAYVDGYLKQGRMFLTQRYVCFFGHIFGYKILKVWMVIALI